MLRERNTELTGPAVCCANASLGVPPSYCEPIFMNCSYSIKYFKYIIDNYFINLTMETILEGLKTIVVKISESKITNNLDIIA